jgi:lipopolysaccharide export LptBFGC system permease protein LptF
MRSTKATTAIGKYGMPVFIGILLLVNVSNIFGPLMVDSKIGLSMFVLSSYFLFAAVAFWLDRKRS